MSLYHIYSLPDGSRGMRRLMGNNRWTEASAGMYVSTPGTWMGAALPVFSTSRPGIAGLYGIKYADAPSTPAIINQVARWNGTEWKRLGGVVHANAMTEFLVDGRWNLVVAGEQALSTSKPVNVVRWDGERWHEMAFCPGWITSMTTWDDGSGTSLYAGFWSNTFYPPLSTQGILRWTGTEWVSVGGGVYGTTSQVGSVLDMKVFDDGTGPALFVLGRFNRAGDPGGIPANNIAKWDGTNWHALAGGVGWGLSLAVADDGRGPSLFVGGLFGHAGGGQVGGIAQWVGCKGNRQCYVDCDNNRVLNANDFQCFMNRFAAKHPHANCDQSTAAPAINAADFQCFLNKYAQGCP
jgi:hypothetical protein